MKDMIILKNTREKKEILKSIADKTVPVKLTWALSLVNFVGGYK